jgi:hypothetical protein
MTQAPSSQAGRVWWVGMVLLVLAGTGCGPRVGQVSGKVLYKGQPLPSGTVLFEGPDGSRRGFSPIAADGSYRIDNVSVGVVRIAVVSEPRVPPGLMKPSGPGAQPAAQPKNDHVPIPARYEKPEQSRLTCTVVVGRQIHDIILQPEG